MDKDIPFQAGNVGQFVVKREEITSDTKILTLIREGVSIDFVEEPVQCTEPKPIQFSGKKQEVIDAVIDKFLHKEIIAK